MGCRDAGRTAQEQYLLRNITVDGPTKLLQIARCSAGRGAKERSLLAIHSAELTAQARLVR